MRCPVTLPAIGLVLVRLYLVLKNLKLLFLSSLFNMSFILIGSAAYIHSIFQETSTRSGNSGIGASHHMYNKLLQTKDSNWKGFVWHHHVQESSTTGLSSVTHQHCSRAFTLCRWSSWFDAQRCQAIFLKIGFWSSLVKCLTYIKSSSMQKLVDPLPEWCDSEISYDCACSVIFQQDGTIYKVIIIPSVKQALSWSNSFPVLQLRKLHYIV